MISRTQVLVLNHHVTTAPDALSVYKHLCSIVILAKIIDRQTIDQPFFESFRHLLEPFIQGVDLELLWNDKEMTQIRRAF